MLLPHCNCPPLTRCVPVQLHKSCRDAYEKEVAKLSNDKESNEWIQELECKLAALPDTETQTTSASRVLAFQDEFVRLVRLSVLNWLLNCPFTCPIGFPCCTGPCTCAILQLLYQPLQPAGASNVWRGCRFRRNVLNSH